MGAQDSMPVRPSLSHDAALTSRLHDFKSEPACATLAPGTSPLKDVRAIGAVFIAAVIDLAPEDINPLQVIVPR